MQSIEKLNLFDSLILQWAKGKSAAPLLMILPYLKQQKKKAEEELKAKAPWVLFWAIWQVLLFFVGDITFISGLESQNKVKTNLLEVYSQSKPLPLCWKNTPHCSQNYREPFGETLKPLKSPACYLSKILTWPNWPRYGQVIQLICQRFPIIIRNKVSLIILKDLKILTL